MFEPQDPHTQEEIDLIDKITAELTITETESIVTDDDIFFPKEKSCNSSLGIYRCSGVIHATPKEVLQWYLDTSDHISANGLNLDKYPNKKIAQINDHHQINYFCNKLPFPLSARDWLVRKVHTQVEGKPSDFILVTKSINDDDEGVPHFTASTLSPKPTRGRYINLCKFEALPHNCCRFTNTIRMDIGGNVPKRAAETGLR